MLLIRVGWALTSESLPCRCRNGILGSDSQPDLAPGTAIDGSAVSSCFTPFSLPTLPPPLSPSSPPPSPSLTSRLPPPLSPTPPLPPISSKPPLVHSPSSRAHPGPSCLAIGTVTVAATVAPSLAVAPSPQPPRLAQPPPSPSPSARHRRLSATRTAAATSASAASVAVLSAACRQHTCRLSAPHWHHPPRHRLRSQRSHGLLLHHRHHGHRQLPSRLVSAASALATAVAACSSALVPRASPLLPFMPPLPSQPL